jgi:hypothetical protein
MFTYRVNFGELHKGEVRRILIPRTSVNKGKRKDRDMPFSCKPARGQHGERTEGLASPTDVVGNINGKKASQKRGDLSSHECYKSNLELVEGEGPLYRARPHGG